MIGLALLVMVLLLAVQSNSVSSSPVPLFVWSDKNYWSPSLSSSSSVCESSSCVLDVATTSQVRQLLQDSIATQDSGSGAEVIVAFLYPKLGSSEALQGLGAYGGTAEAKDLAAIQGMVSSSGGSIVVPYLFQRGDNTDSLTGVLLDLVSQSTNSKVISSNFHELRGLGSVVQLDSCSAVISYLRGDSSLSRNGVPDLLLINAKNQNNFAETCMSGVLSELKAMDSSFVALVSAQAPQVTVQTVLMEQYKPQSSSSSSPYSSSSRRLLQDNNFSPSSPNLTGVQYITSNQLLGVMVMFFLLSVLLVGVTALMSVQRPVRMTKHHLQISKEY